MPGKVYANGRRVIHAGDGQTFVAAAPDVCKTLAPSGPTPVPYPNTARSSDLTGGSRKVTIEGSSVAIEGAKLRTSTGDEAGSAGGIISGKTKGALTWGSCSLDVRFEGKGVLRFFEPTLHNGNASNSSGGSPGDNYMMPPQDPETECLHCGKPFDEHEFPELTTDTEVYDDAIKKYRKKRDAHTVGGLDVHCRDHSTKLLAHAGKMQGWLKVGDPIFNFKTGNRINMSRQDLRRLQKGPNRFSVGNCAEQKALHQAWVTGKNGFPFNCLLYMGVGNNLGGPANASRTKKELKKGMLAPCFTCREIMMAMLCQNDPKKGDTR